jgi:hypothetical protein
MGGELCGWNRTLVLLQYDSRFRLYRRNFHRLIGTPPAVKKFHPIELDAMRRFLRRLLRDPHADITAAIRNTAGVVILKISHGYDVREVDDPLVELADRATDQFSKACLPGAFLVDVFPICAFFFCWLSTVLIFVGFDSEICTRMVPRSRVQKSSEGVPRDGERNGRQASSDGQRRHGTTLLTLSSKKKTQMLRFKQAAGTAPASYTSTLLADAELTPEADFAIKWSAASLYSGTPSPSLHSFIN